MIEKLMKKQEEVPTITEVYDSMHRVFDYFDERFDQIDTHFEIIEGRLTIIEHDVKEMKISLTDLQENFQSLSTAFDHDAEVLVDHEERICKLETSQKVA